MAEDVPLALCKDHGLFLKPEARIFIEVTGTLTAFVIRCSMVFALSSQVKLPEIRVAGVSISNWEVMEKVKTLAKPEQFQSLRVVNYSRELIHFEGEFDSLVTTKKVALMLNGKSIKLSGFSDLLKIRAKRSDPAFPTKEEWEKFFQDRGVDTFDEGKPGERPDTVRIRGLPLRWFIDENSEGKPSTAILVQIFEKFGKVRNVSIYDPSSVQTTTHSGASTAGSGSGMFSSFGPGAGAKFLHFEAYVQFEEYSGFCLAMNSLKGMKLVRTEEGQGGVSAAGGTGKEAVAKITVEFDKMGYLSERNIRKRELAKVRMRKELEEQRRKEEEERKVEELKIEMELKAKEEARAQRKAKRLEEKQKKKEQQAQLVSQLKTLVVHRKEQAQCLLRVLLAGAAEAR